MTEVASGDDQAQELVATPIDTLPAARLPQTQGISAAQAKIEAVANLTMKVYERASLLELTDEERERLQAEFPDEAFRPGAAGKDNLIYIEHAHLRDRMNEVFGPGQWALISRSRWTENFVTAKGVPGIRVYVESMLCVRGCFVGEAVGDMAYYPGNESTNFGDAVEGAKSAAFRRCVKELGIGLQAWKKGWCEGWWERHRKARNQSNSDYVPERQYDEPPPSKKPPAKPKPAPKVEDTYAKARAAIDAAKSETELVKIGTLIDDRHAEGKLNSIQHDELVKLALAAIDKCRTALEQQETI